MPEFLEVDPLLLHLPPSRTGGADPVKLHRQLVEHGESVSDMPALLVYRGRDGALMIFDGVTRATRAAKVQPGNRGTVEIVGELSADCGRWPTVGDRL